MEAFAYDGYKGINKKSWDQKRKKGCTSVLVARTPLPKVFAVDLRGPTEPNIS